MAAEAKFEVGDVIRMKKPHPCGSSEWEILRVGADFPVPGGTAPELRYSPFVSVCG